MAAPVLAVKVTEVAPFATVTLPGMVNTLEIAPEIATNAPAAGAGFVKLTVQRVLELTARGVVPHCKEEISRGMVSVNPICCEAPLSEAVTVAL